MSAPPPLPSPSPLRWYFVAAVGLALGLIFVGLHATVTRWASTTIYLGLDRLEAALGGTMAGDFAGATLFASGVGLAVVCYLWLLRSPSLESWSQPRLLLTTAVVSVPIMLAANMLSSDLFGYLAFARTWTVSGGNPLLESASVYPNDTYYEYVWWKYLASPYGPAWLLLSGGLSSGVEAIAPDIIAHVIAFKVLAMSAHLLSGFVIWRIAMTAGTGKAPRIAAAYLLNPLCLLEFAGSGHNDAVVVLFLVTGIYFAQRHCRDLATVALALAAATKIYALPLLGLYGVAVLRGGATASWRHWDFRGAARVGLVAGLTLVTIYAPFWVGFESFAFLRDVSQSEVNNSLPQLIGHYLIRAGVATGDLIGAASNTGLIDSLRHFGLAVLAVTCVRAVYKTVDVATAVQQAAVVAVVMCFVVIWYWPWYAVMPLALGVVAGRGCVLGFSTTLAISSLYIYIAWGYYWALFAHHPSLSNAILDNRAAVTFLAPLGYLLYVRLRSRRKV